MLPNSANSSTPSNFVYLNKPVSQERRFQEFFAPSPHFPPAPPPTPHLRDVTNWDLPLNPRKLVYDPEANARISHEEKAMRLRQERKRQKALKAMQISEDRRRRLMRQEVENLTQEMAQITIVKEKSKQGMMKIFRDSFEAPKENHPEKADKTLPEDLPDAQSTPIIRYTIEELKALRPLFN